MATTSNVFLGLNEQQIYRFVNGRRQHHKRRRRARDARRRQLLGLLVAGKFKYSQTGAIAEYMGINRVTVWRDVVALRGENDGRCLECGQHLPVQDLDGLTAVSE